VCYGTFVPMLLPYDRCSEIKFGTTCKYAMKYIYLQLLHVFSYFFDIGIGAIKVYKRSYDVLRMLLYAIAPFWHPYF
jgi:hypothetical protein